LATFNSQDSMSKPYLKNECATVLNLELNWSTNKTYVNKKMAVQWRQWHKKCTIQFLAERHTEFHSGKNT
jgi:hypothetical protein